MIIIMISLVLILFLSICYLYNRYNEKWIDNETRMLIYEQRLSKVERKAKMNEKMINWLYDQLVKENVKKEKEKEKKTKKEGEKDE